MPRGPRVEILLADVIGNAVKVGRLSSGLETEESQEPSGMVQSGHSGAKARAESMIKEARGAGAKTAAAAR